MVTLALVYNPLGSSAQDILHTFKIPGKYSCVTGATQPANSALCGGYVLLYLLNRMRHDHLGFGALVNLVFTSNLEFNEQKVREFLSEQYNLIEEHGRKSD